MLEQSLRKLFEQQAEAEPPPGRFTVAAVLREGRLRRRRRRIGTVGAPVLAASATLAVILSAALPTAIPGHGRHPASSADAIPREFNLTQVYAKFGWLPARSHLTSGYTSPLVEVLGFTAPRITLRNDQQALTVQARGSCHVQHFPGSLFSLICVPGSRFDAAARAPDINGHRAFWTSDRTTLIWEYGPNAWAFLENGSPMPAATGLRIADGIEFGQHVPIKFASRLTSGHWQVLIVQFQPNQGIDLATEYFVAESGTLSKINREEANGATRDLGDIITTPHTAGESCGIPKSWPEEHLKIHGYKFTLVTEKGTQWHLLCGPDEDGLFVKIYVNGSNPPVTPAGFMERLQLLGTNPADWVTNPLP